MKKKSLLLILLMALIAPWAAKAQTALLEENFNSMSSLATSYSATDWYAYNAGSGNNWTLNTSSGVSSSKCAQYKWNSSYAANCYLVSTPFDVNTQMEELSVSLYEKTASSSYYETFEVFFVKASDVTDNASITSATKYMVIASASYANNTSYDKQTGSNDNSALAGQSVRLVVHCTSAKDQHTLYIDDITVTQTIASSCEKPATLVADPVTANSATLTWTGGSGTYNVEYKKASDAEWTVALTNTTLLTTDLTLEPATTYEARVQSVCTGENSGWKTVDFTTECGIISTFPKSYGFETSEGFPSNVSTPTTNQLGVCWRNEATVQSGAYANRVWGTSTSYKKNGSQSLILPDKGSGSKTMLVFPEMNFSSPNGYIVSFWIYRNGSSSATANPEGFKVYISDCDTIGPNAVFLGHYSRNYGIAYPKTESASGWYNYEIEIPQTTMTGNVHLIFEGQSYYGSATYVDDVKIEVAPTCKKPSGLAKDATTAHTATLHWTNGEATQDAWQIAYSTSSSFAPADNFTPGEGEGLADVTTNPGTIGGLDQSTTYYAYVRANCGSGDYSPWSNAKVSFNTISGKQKPTNLAVLNQTITSDQARVVWKGVATNELHESFEVYYSRLSTKPDPLEADSLIVVSGAVDTTYLFTNLNAEQKYYVWVRDNCGTDGYSDWTSSINFTTASACQTPNGVNAIEVTQTTAKISWNTYGLTTFNLRYKQKDAAYWNETITSITCPYTISTNLEPNNDYLVQVQATCNTEAWSDSGSFTTECGPISVTAEAYSYDFETTQPWNCWEVLTGTTSIQDVTSTSASEISKYHSATHYLRFSGTTRNILALPEFVEETNTLQIKFWTRPESYTNSSCGTFDVGYITNLSDTSTFVKIERYKYNDWTSNTHVQKTVYLDNVPADARIAFRQSNCATNWYWFVDDVEVSVAPLCRPVKDLAYSNVTNHSATITWIKGTEDQDTWQLKYNKEDDFDPDTEGISVGDLDATTYTFNKTLDATSVYYIYVRANCGGTEGNSTWAKTVINTGAAWPAPTTFTASNVTKNSVDLVWNSNGGDFLSGWDLYYVKSETTPEGPTAETPATETTTTLPTNEAPYKVTGLDPESRYYFWVRANHEGTTHSTWKALSGSYITTLIACNVPTGLAVSDIQPTSAKVTWNGDASGYNLRYRTTDAPTTATVILTAGDVWDDGSGYQMLLDADADQYGVAYNGGWTITDYSDFEYLIPTNADFDDASTNVVFENSVSIQIPAGTYDWYITNPSPGDQVYVAGSNGNVGGSYDDYVFEAGKTYEFVLSMYGNFDGVDVTITGGAKSGEPKEVAWIVIEDVTSPYPLPGLTEETNYEVQVQAVCGGEDGESAWSSSYNFATPSACDKPINLAVSALHESASLSWTGYQTNYNVQYRTAEIPAHQEKLFFEDFEEGIPNTWTILTEGTSPNTNGWVTTSNGGSNVAISYSYYDGDNYDADNWLITPQINLQGSLKFKVRDNDDSTWNDEFEVLLSTTGTAKADFTTTLRAMQSPSKTLTEIDPIDLSSYAGQQGYIAIHHLSSGQYYIIVDDFGIYGTEIPTIPAGEWISRNNVTSPVEIDGLTANNNYDWQVQGICKGATTTEWSEGAFTTIDDNTKIFTTAGDWNVAGNWSGGIPTIANDAIIRADVEIPNTIVATAKTVAIEGTPAPTITIKDGAQLKTNTDGLVVTVEKEIAGYGTGNDNWRFISTPLKTYTDPTTVENMLPTNVQSTEYDLFEFDATQVGAEWQNYKQNVFNLVPGYGYLYANTATKTLQFTGTTWASNNSRLTMVINYNGSSTDPFNGWELVGNTFVCNGYLVYTNSDVTSVQEANFYTMNNNGDGYTLSETAVGLTPCEGALISITSETSGKLAYFTENPLSSKAKTGIMNIYLAQNGKTEDMARIRFGEGYNLCHMSFKDGISTIYIPQDDKDYAVVYTESEGEMPLNFKAETTGKYNISFKLDGANVGYLHLYDKLTDADVNLLTNPEYCFIGSPRDAEDRFIIRFSETSTNDIFAYQNGDEIIVNGEGELQIFDVMGRFVTSMEVNGSERISAEQYSNAVYIFRLVGNDVKTQKIVVR